MPIGEFGRTRPFWFPRIQQVVADCGETQQRDRDDGYPTELNIAGRQASAKVRCVPGLFAIHTFYLRSSFA